MHVSDISGSVVRRVALALLAGLALLLPTAGTAHAAGTGTGTGL